MSELRAWAETSLMPMVSHFANGLCYFHSEVRLLDLDPAPAHSRCLCYLLPRLRGPDDLHGGRRLVEDPNGVV